MNVIIANKYQSMLQSLDIDIIKTMYGEFEVDEIIKTFKNFFFQRMILDVTAIKDYKDISKLQKLSVELDMSKVILFFDDTADTSIPNFYSMLVAMGIYNFTKSLDGVQYLLNTPNTYKDVMLVPSGISMSSGTGMLVTARASPPTVSVTASAASTKSKS